MAIGLLPAALVFDVFDGYVARLSPTRQSVLVQRDLWLGVLRIGPMLCHPLALVYVLSGSAMISTVRIPKP